MRNNDMPYYDPTQVKTIMGENGASNDAKVLLYGDMADSYINSFLVNVEDNIPITSPPTQLKKIATLLAVAYFFKFESGDTLTADQAEMIWNEYFKNKYKRPSFFITK